MGIYRLIVFLDIPLAVLALVLGAIYGGIG